MIVVVGAGAAGLVAAIFARANGRAVTLVERTADGGRKILISGGGRCNVLPAALEPARFVSDSPRPLVQRLLRSWPLRAQREFFEQDAGVPLTFEAETHKWFPASGRARDVRDALISLARRRGVAIQFGTEVVGLRQLPDRWQLDTSRGPIDADAVIIATGGLSVPTTGSTGTGLEIARALGHHVHDTYPALTPLLTAPAVHAHLSGVSVTATVRAVSSLARADAHGGLLFTHRGYSGPAVLDISHVVARSSLGQDAYTRVLVRWCDLDDGEWQRGLTSATGLVVKAVAAHLPQRLAEQLVLESEIPLDRRAAELRRADRVRLITRLVRYELPWTGDDGYGKAEVTGGGVALDQVSPRTLESAGRPRLFFCGEVLDAFGPIGGHNFAWAWATGRLAGLGATEPVPGSDRD